MLHFNQNLYFKKIQIFFLKFQIICSIIETSFRQYILEFTNNKWILFLALVFPITFSYQFLDNSNYKKVLSLLEKNLPGTLLGSNTISWETFQKTYYLPISDNSFQLEDNLRQKQLNPISHYDKQFVEQTVKTIDYWGDFITFDFLKNWTSYRKNYLAGSSYQTNSNLRPVFFVARDNIDSPFYFCYFWNNSTFEPFKNLPKLHNKYYQVDEFPRKLSQMNHSNHRNNFIKTPVQCNRKNTLFTVDCNFIHKNDWPKTGHVCAVIPIQSQSDYGNQFVGIQPNGNLKPIHLETVKTLPNSIAAKLNPLGGIVFEKQLNFQNQLNCFNSQLQDLFYTKGYVLPKKVFSLESTNWSQPSQLLPNKYHSIAANQILEFIQTDPNIHRSIDNSENSTISSIFTGRLMSGFHYPDLNLKDLLAFNRQNLYSSKIPNLRFFGELDVADKLKIYLGSHFVYPTEYSDFKPNPIRLHLKYYSAKFEGNDSNTQYSGPVILEKGVPSVYNSTNWFKVRQNLQEILSQMDPRQIQQTKYFGNTKINAAKLIPLRCNDFLTEITTQPSKKELNTYSFQNTQTEKFYRQLLKRQELTAEKETLDPSISYSYEFVVPFLKSPEWHSWLINQNLNNSNQLPYIQSFPIRQLAFLKNIEFSQFYDVLDYQNPTKFLNWFNGNENLRTKLNTHEYPLTEAALSSSIIRQNYATVTYLKRTNQCNKVDSASLQCNKVDSAPLQYKFVNSETNWIQSHLSNLSNSTQFNSFTKRENWEPLHLSSWLVVSQYVFAICVIHLLRQFALSYGRELVSYLIDLFSSLGIFDSSFKEDLISEDSRYRIVNKPKTRFKNIAGIEQIFSQLSEIVWFLRNSKRFMDTGHNLPKGILLVGPPGTGKTLLVQAIAGEAQIPIFLQPAGAFNTTESLGAQRLQKLFEKAKQLAPCIIFFDEIDSIGKRRSHIIQNPAGTDNLLNIVSNTSWQTTNTLANSIPFQPTYITNPMTEREAFKMNSSIESESQDQQSSDQLSLLMQLLIELDGLQCTKKIVIIGATNRVEVLDPALIRPGRFDKVLKLGLPKKYKRIQICKLYAQILGIENKIYWEYIGNKTFGLSGADLATIMNQSSIDAILKGTKHTMQSIELAIHKIIGDSTKSTVIEQLSLAQLNQNLVLNNHSQSFIPRLAYYQAGLVSVKLALPQLSTPIACSLFPKHENVRYQKVANDFLTGQLQISRRHELKAQLITLYSGKMAEFLYFKRGLNTPNQHAFHSDFANKDLTKATNLIYQIVDHWYLYLNPFSSEKLFHFSGNQNHSELLDMKTQSFLTKLSENKELLSESIEFAQYYNFQSWSGKSWWQIQVTKEETYTNVAYANWYRIYLKNPDEVIDNDEWVMPDQYYHNNETYFLTKTNHFNDIQINQRDFVYQTILLDILEETFEFFHESTEFIDFMATFLIKNKYLRRFEIDHLYQQFWNQCENKWFGDSASLQC